jgi:hypothetical protein
MAARKKTDSQLDSEALKEVRKAAERLTETASLSRAADEGAAARQSSEQETSHRVKTRVVRYKG